MGMTFESIGEIILFLFVLFIVIYHAVKLSVSDALDEFKEKIVKEYDLKKVIKYVENQKQDK